ncbi:MAG TPA: hypothetical protein VEY33_00570 [Gemmatimonadota bacterium]|nr:hypothetical protein [Gemmatimonadota bacterium]
MSLSLLLRLAFAGTALVAAPWPPLHAQSALELRVSVDRAELRWSSTGRRLGSLERGVLLERLGGRAGWARVGVHGWMWSASLERAGDAYRVVPESENLRSGPGGRVVGQLVEGVGVRRVGAEGRWLEIEIVGWLPESSVSQNAAPEPARASADTARPAAPTPSSAQDRPVEEEVVAASAMGTLSRGVEMRNAPQGGAIAPLPAETPVRVLESRGGWTRVRVDGWVPSSAVRAGALGEVGPDVVAAAPAGTFIGRTVRWTLEHVALQQADPWRPDFEPGEWYDLARVPGVEGRYVYLALPARMVDEFRGMSPFRTLRVEGRVRTGQSALTGTPIVELTRLLP